MLKDAAAHRCRPIVRIEALAISGPSLALIDQPDIDQFVEVIVEIVGFDIDRGFEISGTQFVVGNECAQDPKSRWVTDRLLHREILLEKIRRLTEELGKVPTAKEMSAHGEFSHKPYIRRWNGWQAAVRAAGYEPVGQPAGPDHHNWKEQPVHEWREYGDNWDEQRQKALERDDYTCQTPSCEWTQEAHGEAFKRRLHVHHIRPLSTFGADENEVNFGRANRLDNLVTVCAEHHHLWERASPLRLDTR